MLDRHEGREHCAGSTSLEPFRWKRLAKGAADQAFHLFSTPSGRMSRFFVLSLDDVCTFKRPSAHASAFTTVPAKACNKPLDVPNRLLPR
ncbi:hypothetical protein SJI00_08830 [Pseudomonas sp. RP23018S]|uniref:hypothetical protein n=1 Tax=Pseudomonas sp. RP23018S TaxID=3096037 RepID=UPI002ACA965E|nr:hypothetical protein [Pseudomonas sp. RP23018S]MDZ5602878.1 hypothetical protein [Pseudomonas sp. RP23018S]